MTEQLPDHVRAAVVPKVKAVKHRVSPYRPYPSAEWPLPSRQWVVMYTPGALLIALLIVAVPKPEGLLLPVLVFPGILGFLYRYPQERKRSQKRMWFEDHDARSYTWHDPSGEWSYARWQSPKGPRRLGKLLAGAQVLLWVYAVFIEPGFHMILWGWVSCFLIYLHRHLPTPLRPSHSYLHCNSCGMTRPTFEYPICPRCGRVSVSIDQLAVPSLQRRWRDL